MASINSGISHYSGRKVLIGGKEYLYFGGTNYLGTHVHPFLREKLIQAVKKYGVHLSITRRSSVGFSLYEQAEEALANWMGVEKVLLVSSGFTACQITLKILREEKNIHLLPSFHAAHGESLSQIQNHVLASSLPSGKEKNTAFIGCPLDHLLLEEMSTDWMEGLPSSSMVVWDDSHLLGIRGKDGEGSLSQIPDGVLGLSMGSLGKGLGLPAGWVAGPMFWLDRIQGSPFYGGASMPNLLFMEVLLALLKILPSLRESLQRNVDLFLEGLQEQGLDSEFDYLPAYPIFGTADHKLFSFLQERGILISSFSYPSPSSPLRTRLVISACHEKEDLHRLISALKTFFVEIGKADPSGPAYLR
ncbi:MAG: aminotransferase class I/II-fold pyridoxal phosphate-dependent enzyme [Cytophagales bacterium]|nr:aminotransferase class I/II-fold pyridoxal phosphate-dependent enzyme [Cytophagales bacterium]